MLIIICMCSSLSVIPVICKAKRQRAGDLIKQQHTVVEREVGKAWNHETLVWHFLGLITILGFRNFIS